MGMSASQARLLSITARMNDVEYKSQQISNTKIRLSDESEQVANAYTKALNRQKLTFTDYTSGQAQKINLNSTELQKYAHKFQLVDANYKPVDLTQMKFDEATLYEMLESGQYMLQEYTTKTDAAGQEKTDWFDTSVSSNTQLSIETDSTQLAKAEAEYNAATAKINRKEKLLDNDLKALDTEHNALKTEYDSVKSLIGDNIDKSFQLFS